jgi:5-methylcytosine-specific restriction endonuclease McrA
LQKLEGVIVGNEPRRVISQQIVFKPPGKCIYCGSPGDPKLHTEHIIPDSLGGRFEFLKARFRAERHLGEMFKAQKETVRLAKGGHLLRSTAR